MTSVRIFAVNLDDELCLCFHVTKRKVVNFIRIQKPKRPGQLSDCFSAGTGCGWCRPFLEQLFNEGTGTTDPELPSTEQYAQQRKKYIQDGKGTPPPSAAPPPADEPNRIGSRDSPSEPPSQRG